MGLRLRGDWTDMGDINLEIYGWYVSFEQNEPGDRTSENSNV